MSGAHYNKCFLVELKTLVVLSGSCLNSVIMSASHFKQTKKRDKGGHRWGKR